MATPIKRVVPWMNRSEWENVYKEIYSNDHELLCHAVRRMSAWKSRSQQRLSTAIEATRHLATAKLEDNRLSRTSHDALSDHKLRLLYAMALIRFVNLITEKNQTKLFAQKTQLLAEEMGIPDWLVDLRHDSTHAALPALEQLRAGIQIAFDWLKREYWEAELDNTHMRDSTHCLTASSIDSLSDSAIHDNISQLLINISQHQYKYTDEAVDRSQKKELNEALGNLMADLHLYIQLRSCNVISCLVEDGFLLASEEQLAALNVNVSELLEPVPLSSDSNAESDMTAPLRYLIEMWQPVLSLIHRAGCIDHLVQAFLARLTEDDDVEEDPIRNLQIISWLQYLLSTYSVPEADKAEGGQSKLELNGRAILKHLLYKPNIWTRFLLPIVFKICSPRVRQSRQQKLLQLLQCYTEQSTAVPDSSAAVGDTSSDATQLYTADMLAQESVNTLSSSLCDTTTQVESSHAWRLATERSSWCVYPLGHVFTESLDYTTLDLPQLSVIHHPVCHDDDDIRVNDDINEDEICSQHDDVHTHQFSDSMQESLMDTSYCESEEDVTNYRSSNKRRRLINYNGTKDLWIF